MNIKKTLKELEKLIEAQKSASKPKDSPPRTEEELGKAILAGLLYKRLGVPKEELLEKPLEELRALHESSEAEMWSGIAVEDRGKIAEELQEALLFALTSGSRRKIDTDAIISKYRKS